MENCFECGEIATEQHHVIPKVLGGKKTVPLCTACHMKVHGLDGTKRADNHLENIKRGLDKNRVWDLFALYQINHIHRIDDINEIKLMLENEFNHSLTIDQINRLFFRLNEVDEKYLEFLFDQNIDTDLSHIWNKNDRLIRDKIVLEVVKFNAFNMNKKKNDKNSLETSDLYDIIEAKFQVKKKSVQYKNLNT